MRFFKKKSKKLKKIQKNSKKFKKNLNNLKNFHNFSGGAAAGGGMPQDIAAEVSNIIKVSLKIGYVFQKYYYFKTSYLFQYFTGFTGEGSI